MVLHNHHHNLDGCDEMKMYDGFWVVGGTSCQRVWMIHHEELHFLVVSNVFEFHPTKLVFEWWFVGIIVKGLTKLLQSMARIGSQDQPL